MPVDPVKVLESKERDIRELLARDPFSIHLDREQFPLFRMAFTHDSFTEEYNKRASSPMESYERLEFLGDAVLEFIVCDEAYRIKSLGDEGSLTNAFKQKAVSNESIARHLREAGVDLGSCMLLGNSFRKANGDKVTDDMRSDVFEALVAAVYQTLGMDCARAIIRRIILDPLVKAEGFDC